MVAKAALERGDCVGLGLCVGGVAGIPHRPHQTRAKMDAKLPPRMAVQIRQRTGKVMETLPHRRAKDFLALGEVDGAEDGLGLSRRSC